MISVKFDILLLHIYKKYDIMLLDVVKKVDILDNNDVLQQL